MAPQSPGQRASIGVPEFYSNIVRPGCQQTVAIKSN